MLIILIYLIHACYGSYLPRFISDVSIPHPAFTLFIQNPQINTNYHLAISTFNAVPLTSDQVYYIPDFKIGSTNPQKLNNEKLVWPNDLAFVNESIFNEKIDPHGGLIVPYGFLVPTKSNGGLAYYPFTSYDRTSIVTTAPVKIAIEDKTEWFYHRVKHVDVTGDGIKDILTCRTHKPIIGKTQVELVAYVFDESSMQFKENVLSNDACDVFFDVADIDNDGRIEIIAAGFFISKLNLIYSNDPMNNFTNQKQLVEVPIDTNAGKLFDIIISDLDKKGNLELLVTNHQGEKDAIKGAIFYYELSGNVRSGSWKRNLIYQNFTVLKSGVNQAAPGGAKLVYPNLKDTNGSPHIILAGDGSEYAYLFEPTTSNNGLNYSLTWSQYFKDDTVGQISCQDINNDGYSECVIPLYEANNIKVFTFAP